MLTGWATSVTLPNAGNMDDEKLVRDQASATMGVAASLGDAGLQKSITAAAKDEMSCGEVEEPSVFERVSSAPAKPQLQKWRSGGSISMRKLFRNG